MGIKAASIRLIDKENDELVIKAGSQPLAGVSEQRPGPAEQGGDRSHRASASRDMNTSRNMADRSARAISRGIEARRDRLDALGRACATRAKPIGVLRVYTAEEQTFTPLQIDLLKAVAAQAAAAIENTRLLTEAIEAGALEKQVAARRRSAAADDSRRRRRAFRASSWPPSTSPPSRSAAISTISSRCRTTTSAWSSPTSAAKACPRA